MTWTELTKKKVHELSDGERVAIIAVIRRSTDDRPDSTMEAIFNELLEEYTDRFPIDRWVGGTQAGSGS